jgi:YidC/Oxa1 family membrane protein insertase
MSMERRALLAFVASMLLFLAYDALYLSPRVKKQEEARRARMEQLAADSLAASSASLGSEGASSDSAVTPPPAQPATQPTEPVRAEVDTTATLEIGLPRGDREAAKTFTVVNDVYEITLSSAGGEIVSMRLPKYLTDGQPVELFPQNPDWTDEGVLSLSLRGENTTLDLNDVTFDAFQGLSPTPLADGSRVTVDTRRGYTDIVFRAETPDGRTIERSYRFYPDRYDFDASVRLAREAFPAIVGVAWGFGPGMTTTEANVTDDQGNFKASIQLGEEFHRIKPSHFSNESTESFAGTLNWASLQTKYFLSAIVPPEPTRAEIVVSGDKEEHRISERITMPVAANQAEVSQSVRVYLGPLEYRQLQTVGAGLDKTIEMGWRWMRPVAWIVLKAMVWMYQFIPNYGWVIIIISVLTKVLFYRLTHKSFKSMKEMQALQPKLAAIKEKYGDDRQRVSQETMKLYKEAGVNPLGGCLPMLLQMPVFVALFNVLKYTIEVRGAHWIGWINDLSQQDVLFTMPFSLPIIGNAFSLLPILMGGAMFLQSKLGGSPTGGTSMAQPAGMQTMLPIVFTVMFYRMPSGLVIYWIVNTVLSVAQQYYIHRDSASDTHEQPAAVARPRRAKKER